MSQILVTKSKFNFKLGYVFKVGIEFFEILGIEPVQHYELVNEVTTLKALDQSFESNLRPSDGYMYWIEKIGIDGALGFQLKFPAVPRWTVHGEKRYIYRHRASFMNPIYMPILVRNPNYPRFTFYNPELATKAAIMYFEGERWIVSRLDGAVDVYTDLTSYTDLNIGEG